LKIQPEEFDYLAVAKSYFGPLEEEPYPLTVRRGINTFGNTSRDGRFLYFASDAGGNFDIVFRDLKTSVVVPITKHPSNETKPAISPDGKKLVYVSEQYDSDGDLMLMKIEPEEWLEAYLKGDRYATQERSVVLTNKNFRDPEKIVRAVDTDPSWSPDGRYIVYTTSSYSPGKTNIAIIDTQSDFASKQITSNGGASPVFSHDAKKIYYLSYKDNPSGEIYELDLSTNSEVRLTNDAFLDFNPTVSPDGKFLFYTSIRRDTNGNGKLETRDNAFIIRYDLQTKQAIEITAGNFSIFDCKYSSLIGGSLIFTASIDNALNIYFIPQEGEIPKQKNINLQYEISKEYRKRSADFARLAFNSIYLYYGNDPLYPLYKSKSDNQMVQEYESEGKIKDSEELLEKMLATKNHPQFGLSYAYAISHLERKKGRLPDKILNSYYNDMKSLANVHPDLPPSILSVLSAAYAFRGDFKSSNEINERILLEYPNFFEKVDLKRYVASVKFENDRSKIPEDYIKILGSIDSNRTENKYILDDVLTDLQKIDDNQKRIDYAEHLLDVQKKELESNPEMLGLLRYNQAEALNNLDKFEESIKLIDSYLPSVTKGSYVYLNSLLLQSENYRELGKIDVGQEKLLEFVRAYNFESGVEVDPLKIETLLEYYETKARIYEVENKLKEAALTYQANNEFLSLAEQRKLPIKKIFYKYNTFYQKKFVDTVLKLSRSIIEEKENSVLSKINLVDQLDVQGRSTETLAFFFKNEIFRLFGDFRDLQYVNYLDSDSLEIAKNYYEKSLEAAKDNLNLGVIYGYAYYLIARSVLEEENYRRENNLTYARKKKLLGDLKQAEYELLWIIYSDSDYVDAYLLLGWLYQYIEVKKLQDTFPEFQKEKDVYYSAYIQTFPRKYLEENIDLYTQLIEFLDKKSTAKFLSDINLNLGNNYFLLNNYQKALVHYDEVEKLSVSIIDRNRFEGYKQAALFYFNYARSKVYNGYAAESIPLLRKSLEIYYQSEYYPNVSKTGIKKDRKLQNELEETKKKLALLHALIGLVEMELESYKDAIQSFSMSISMNGNSEFINDISLYNSIAICYQKVGDYKKSEWYLKQADQTYKEKKDLVGFFQFDIWDVILPDSQRVIGEGRFPSEMPLEFSNLLTKGIRIKNNLDLHEHSEAEELIHKRNKFIKSESLQKYVIGEELLHRSRNDLAYNQYIRGKYLEAAELYKKDFEYWNEVDEDTKAFIAFQRQSLSLFSHLEENSEDKNKLYEYLKEQLESLNKLKQKEITNCLPKLQVIQPEINVSTCEKDFVLKRPDFDVIAGYIYYYLGEIDYNRGNLEEAFHYYGISLKLLKNPADIPDSEIGLSTDKFSLKERARLKIAIPIIHLRLGELQEFESKLKEANYFAAEFQFDLELATTYILKAEYIFKYGKKKSDFQSAVKSIETAEEILRKSPGTFYDINEVFINYLYTIKAESLIQADRFDELSTNRERMYSAIFFRQLLVNEFKFQDPKNFNLLNTLQNYVIEDDEYSDKIENGLMQGMNVTKILQSKEKNYAKFLKTLEEFSNQLPKGMDIMSWFGKKRNTSIPNNSQEIVIELFKNNDRYVQASYYQGKREFHKYDVTDGDPLQDLENALEHILHDKPDVKSIVLIPSPKMSMNDFNKLKFKDKSLNDYYSIRYLFRLSQLERESNMGFTRLRRVTSVDTRPIVEKNFINKLLINPLELIIRPVTIESEKLKELNLRIIPSQELRYYLMDTDILEGPTDFINRKQYLGEKREGFINIKEIVENQWDVPVIILNNYFRSQDTFMKMGFLYDILQFSGTQSIVLIESNQNSETVRNNLLSDIKNVNSTLQKEKIILIGELLSPYPDNQKKYKEEFERFTRLGIEEERNQNYLQSMRYFLSANSVLPDNDSDAQIRAEMNIDRIRTFLFNENNFFQHYESVLDKFKDLSDKKEKILFDMLIVCYENRENLDCKKYYSEYKSLNPTNDRLFVIDYYKNLRENNFTFVDENYERFLKLSASRDPYLFHFKFSYLLARNFHWEKAEFHIKEAIANATKGTKQKALAEDSLANLEFEKFFIRGFLPGKEHDNKLYSMAINRRWNQYAKQIQDLNEKETNYYIRSYKKRIFDSFQKLESSSDFQPLSLGPLYMKDGTPSLILLNETERDFLFYILLRAIGYQRGEELNNQMDILLKVEKDQGNQNRYLWMGIAWASALYYRGDFVGARKYMLQFEDLVNPKDKELYAHYLVLKFKLSKHQSDVELTSEEKESISKISDSWVAFYDLVDNSTDTNQFGSIIIDLAIQKKEVLLDYYNHREITDLLSYMARKCLEKKDYLNLFNIIRYKERIQAYNDRILDAVPKFKNIPRFRSDLSAKLASKLPSSQSFKALLDIGTQTYLWSLENGKIDVSLVFEDNREIKFNVLSYLFSVKDEGVNIISQEALENYYRKAISLKPNQLTYLYMPSYHFKAVLEPEELDNFYVVLSPEQLVDRPIYNSNQDYLNGFRINILGDNLFSDNSWRKLKKLENMEYRLNTGSGRGNPFIVSEEELRLEENRVIRFGSKQLGAINSGNRIGPWAITSSSLGKTSLHNDDFVHSLYFLDNLHYGPGVVNFSDQKDTHVAMFMRYFLRKTPEQITHFERFIDAYLKVQENAREDKYWNGWKPYTNVIISERK
jgi:Tol biopolymer transport system component